MNADGEIFYYPGDIEITEIDTREVQHYNTYNQWIIPLAIGYELIKNERLQFSIGPDIYISQTIEGRYLSNDQVLDLSESDNYNSVFGKIGLRTALHTNIKLHPRWQIVAGIEGGLSPSLSDRSQYAQTITRFGGRVGMRYRFN